MYLLNNYQRKISVDGGRVPIILKSLLIGICVAVVVIAYRLALSYAGKITLKIYDFVNLNRGYILPLFIGLAFLSWLVGRMVRKNPMISGSGIPQVEGQIMGYLKNNWLSTLILKFIGGTLAVFAGLSVGREGPSIQLGASVAEGISNRTAKTRTEQKILIASGASAGLAAAFHAPLAGVIFALEEIFKYFSSAILLATITAAVAGNFVSEIVFGLEPIFSFNLEHAIPHSQYWLIIVLGIFVGLAGAFYNFFLVKTLAVYRKIGEFNQHLKILIPFMVAGILGLTFPIVLGGGDHIVELFGTGQTIKFLLLILVVKFLFSMVSFGSGVPGGIFFPLLVLGGLVGGIFGQTVILKLGVDPLLLGNFTVLAMAGFFTAIVRAPITGIVLLTEMTGSFTHLLPLTAVSIVAFITADLLKSTPIYESLLKNQLKNQDIDEEVDSSRKVTIEKVIHHGSWIEGRTFQELNLPNGSLAIALRRHGQDITPSGSTIVQASDLLVVLTGLNDETKIRELLAEKTEAP